jgi:TonB family protein
MSMTKLKLGIVSGLLVSGTAGFALQRETEGHGRGAQAHFQLAAAREAGAAEVPVYDVSKLDQAPRPTFQAKPRYPAGLRKAGTAGEAVVDFIVDASGEVRDAYAIKSTHPEFEVAAVEAVSQWKFKPGQKNGRAVHTHMQVPIVFTLSGK